MRYRVTLTETIERTAEVVIEAKDLVDARKQAERQFHEQGVQGWVNQVHLGLRSDAEPE